VLTESVLGLPALLRLLATHPDGSRLASALKEGVLGTFGARSAIIWVLPQREVLTLIGFAGFLESDLARWHQIPMTFDSQMVDVVRNNEVIVTPICEFPIRYPNATFDRVRFREMHERLGGWEGDLVGIPIVHKGLCLGVVQFTTAGPREWNSLDFSVLDGISSALGLWLTHPDTPVTPNYTTDASEISLILTDRQKEIITLVLQGVGNHQIANELLVSVSTVKQDLQKLMRATHQSDRLAAAKFAVEMGLVTPPPATRVSRSALPDHAEGY
jgi:DNA-binding CsgD family transcriptional regulator